MADKMASEERAFLADAFPVNAFPFLNRMVSILRENNCNNFQSLPAAAKIDYRACLWVVNGQAHGQMAVISQSNEWDMLARAVKAIDAGAPKLPPAVGRGPSVARVTRGPEMTKGKR